MEDIEKGKLISSGKAKSLYESSNPDYYFMHYRDDTSAFDGVKTESLEMYAQKIFYNKEQDYVELFDNVKVIRATETITGDYGKINMQNQSYKISSKDKSKVKVSLSNNDDE